jgi:DNA-directed RNA polymerase specialized sigma24 family protein
MAGRSFGNSRDEAFDNLLVRLEPNLATREGRFEVLLVKLQKFFAWRRCEDLDDLASETLYRLYRDAGDLTGRQAGEPRNPYSLVYGIATNVFKEYLRKRRRQAETLSLKYEALSQDADRAEDCRRECLRKLLPDDLRILTSYYVPEVSKQVAAQEMGVSLNALRLMIQRIKRGLRACQEECLKRSAVGDQ